MSIATTNDVFGRITEHGNVSLFLQDGSVCTRLDANVYPVGSNNSARNEHPDGIVLYAADAARLRIKMES